MSEEVGSIHYSLDLDKKQFEKGLNSAKSNVSKFDKTLEDSVNTSKKMAVGIGAMGVAAGAFSYKAIQMASDVEEMQGKFNVVFKNTAPMVTKSLSDFGNEVGRSRYELMGMAATLGDTLKPMGFTEEAAADLSVDLVKLGTDLGSFNNMEMDEALRRLQGTLIGSHENALAFGVVINQNTLKAEMAKNGWDNLTGSQLEAAKVQARINLLMQGTTDAQGDAARTSGSYANQVRALQANIEQLQIELGTKLLPIATQFVSLLTEKGIPAIVELTNFAKENETALKALAIGITAMLVPAFVAWTIAAGKAAIATLIAAAPLIALGLVVAALAYIVMKNWDNIKNAIESLKNAFASIPKFVSSVFSGLADIILRPFRQALDGVRDMAGKIKEQMNKINPFARFSPSLVDQVKKGVGIIENEFASLGQITLEPIAHTLSADSMGMGGSNVVNIGQVNERSDIDMIQRELGFRSSLRL